MINSFFYTELFAVKLEYALVSPIFKRGGPNLVSNYRPISIFPVPNEVFENCLSKQLLNFLMNTHY